MGENLKISILFSDPPKIQLNPGNSNCQGKLKLFRVIGVSSYRVLNKKTRDT